MDADRAPTLPVCVGFDPAPSCGFEPEGLRIGGGRFGGRLGPIYLGGYNLRLEAEAADGGRGRLCLSWDHDLELVAPNGCTRYWECAVSGTIVLTAGGGGTLHAEFAEGATVDWTFAEPLP